MASILLIDDDQFLRHLLRVVLERQGYAVVEAENGDEGLQCYQAAPTDLVITDMQMPVMDGLQMIAKLRHAFPMAKIIAISGGRKELNIAKTLVQRTLEKPLCAEQLLEAVQDLIPVPAPPGVEHGVVVAP